MRAASPSCGLLRERLPAPALSAALAAAAKLAMQLKQQLAGWPVGTMNREGPAHPVGFAADFVAVLRDPRLVVVAPGFGAACCDGAGAFRFHELDATSIGKRFFRRIDDLDGVAM